MKDETKHETDSKTSSSHVLMAILCMIQNKKI